MNESKKTGNQYASTASNSKLSLKEKARLVIEENNTRIGQLFDIAIQCLIVFSLVIYSLSTLPDLPPLWEKIIAGVDFFCYLIFTIEYFSRIYISRKPLKYIFSFYGIIDLLAILPFLLASEFDLRAIRALRVFRIIRALKISNYNDSLRHFAIALKIIKPELILFAIIANVFIFISATGIYYFENEAQPQHFTSIFDSLWWAIITLTTVGYGDIYPITAGGRVFTFIILFIGLGIITIPTGLIASALSTARNIQLNEDHQSAKPSRTVENNIE